MLQSNQITSAKIMAQTTASTSTIELAEFEALIGGTILQDLDTQIGMRKSEIEAASAEKKALQKDISLINGKIASFKTQDVLSGKTGETKSFDAVALSNDEYKELAAYAKKMGLSQELADNTNLAEKFGKNNKVTDEFKTALDTKLTGLKDKNKKSILTAEQIATLKTTDSKAFETALKNLKLSPENESKVRNAYTSIRNARAMDADTNHEYVSPEFLKTFKENLDNRLTDLNSQTETDSIKFQALMDARKQNILMLSNMINSDNQTKMAIINNMKS